MKTSDYVELLRKTFPNEKTGQPCTCGALAPKLDVSRQAVYRYKDGLDCFSDEVAHRVGTLLDIDPLKVIADVKVEGTNSPELKRMWTTLSKKTGRAAAYVLTAGTMAYLLIGMSYAPSAEASAGSLGATTTYYVKRLLQALRRALVQKRTPFVVAVPA